MAWCLINYAQGQLYLYFLGVNRPEHVGGTDLRSGSASDAYSGDGGFESRPQY
jgi:hypothetical protein